MSSRAARPRRSSASRWLRWSCPHAPSPGPLVDRDADEGQPGLERPAEALRTDLDGDLQIPEVGEHRGPNPGTVILDDLGFARREVVHVLGERGRPPPGRISASSSAIRRWMSRKPQNSARLWDPFRTAVGEIAPSRLRGSIAAPANEKAPGGIPRGLEWIGAPGGERSFR